jgi:putative Ca2+/H+ antiporter (TMEM165/GDT1 family)
MSYVQALDNIPVWVLFIITTLVFSIASELGFRVGKFIHERLKREQNPMVGTILGASLGLLAFFSSIYLQHGRVSLRCQKTSGH